MRQLLYVSNTSRSLPHDTLAGILKISRRNNAQRGITGVLLYLDGSFLQVLEGDADAVEQTFRRIRLDKRHWGARMLLDEVAPPAFAEWSMGYHQPSENGSFSLSKAAIEKKLAHGASPELTTFLQTFYRVHLGDNFELAKYAV